MNQSTSPSPDLMPRFLSERIKAIAMLLIILGHNHILCPKTPEPSAQFTWLYSFHVSIFFFLPFFYIAKGKIDYWQKTVNTIVRLFVPYTVFFTLCYLIYSRMNHTSFDLARFISGYTGNSEDIKAVCGFAFPWFLPAFCVMSLVKLYANKYKLVMLLALVFGFMALSWKSLQVVDLFCFNIAIRMFVLGMACLGFIKYFGERYMLALVVIFAVCTVVQLLGARSTALVDVMRVSGFFSVWYLAKYLNFSSLLSKSLDYIGVNSLVIYLIHVFIYNALERLLPSSIIFGLIIYVLTIIISVLCVMVLNKMPLVKRIIFPRSLKDYKFA